MTYDPSDVANGLLIHVQPGNGDTSPTGRLVLELDRITDALLDGALLSPSPDTWKGRAQGIVFALTVVTCYTEEQVRKQNLIRRTNRAEGRESHDHGINLDASPPTSRPRRKRSRG